MLCSLTSIVLFFPFYQWQTELVFKYYTPDGLLPSTQQYPFSACTHFHMLKSIQTAYGIALPLLSDTHLSCTAPLNKVKEM